ncbi:hypothetical protein GCM10007978_20000 [Shewanella hanedai]|uniref:RiboL-PSP-HEPN domain-containing protein n=1 Tax=Shewanella hanedai TaxID=25 RepID=A0A553JM43_SHEHA|nr:hypothetical protein [Shewanella hanedai]TRY13549.1 hypothetical protein FN961_15015 [Shewanella hanedai]GGI82210.1 hypothetical protein GCM10007978_20000 [Shewanella hanedai]
MGTGSNWAVEVAEENYNEAKSDWIQNALNDPEADENTEGWFDLSERYDEEANNYSDYLEAEYEWHSSQDHSNFIIEFNRTIDEIRRILSSTIDQTVMNTIYKMIHIHAVTAMETYLGDSLKSAVIGNKIYIANAARNLEELSKKNFKLSEILSYEGDVEKIVLEQLGKYLYHDVSKVMKIYKATLGFSYTYDLKYLIEITTVRHDLVHRNGKNNEGVRVNLNPFDLKNAIDEVDKFINYLEISLQNHQP